MFLGFSLVFLYLLDELLDFRLELGHALIEAYLNVFQGLTDLLLVALDLQAKLLQVALEKPLDLHLVAAVLLQLLQVLETRVEVVLLGLAFGLG